MSNAVEAAYRQHLADASEHLGSVFNTILPPDQPAGDPAAGLVRGLCFEPARYEDAGAPAFAEHFPFMLDHGVRQAALAAEVLADGRIQRALPQWFDHTLFLKALVVADAGLTFVSAEEVETVHEYGPKYAQEYVNHPRYGYGMATALGLEDPASHMIASFTARHHMVQARNCYGLEWPEIDRRFIKPAHVDLMVALQKPFDYFDDYIDRSHPEIPYNNLVAQPVDRFVQSVGQLLCTNLQLFIDMQQHGFDPGLPSQIIMKIQEVVTDDTEMGAVYRELRPTISGLTS